MTSVINNRIVLELAGLTANTLDRKQDELQHCKWADGESNTDTDYSILAGKCAEEAWPFMKEKYLEYGSVDIVTSLPDLHCTFISGGVVISKNKIELKSSKSPILPGSTIGKLDINQPVIFCYRNPNGTFQNRYGQYHTAMGESNTDLFQDRTPRPPINFNKLFPSSHMEIIYSEKKKDDWVTHYGKCAVNRLKQAVSHSWQDKLTRTIIYEALQDIHSMEDLIQLRESLQHG